MPKVPRYDRPWTRTEIRGNVIRAGASPLSPPSRTSPVHLRAALLRTWAGPGLHFHGGLTTSDQPPSRLPQELNWGAGRGVRPSLYLSLNPRFPVRVVGHPIRERHLDQWTSVLGVQLIRGRMGSDLTRGAINLSGEGRHHGPLRPRQ